MQTACLPKAKKYIYNPRKKVLQIEEQLVRIKGVLNNNISGATSGFTELFYFKHVDDGHQELSFTYVGYVTGTA